LKQVYKPGWVRRAANEL